MQLGLFAATVFTGATLLFWIQPLFAKMVLPVLGGSSAVWNTAMVFFQAVLLAGYAYAHLLARALKPGAQVLVHLVCLGMAAVALPIEPADGWQPDVGDPPTLWLLGLLAGTVGAPFFAVSATAPLMLRWFSQTGHPHADDPYFLYAASNVGSIVVLLAYPFVLEPWLGIGTQATAWAVGFALLGAFILGCGIAMAARARHSGGGRGTGQARPLRSVFPRSRRSPGHPEGEGGRPHWRTVLASTRDATSLFAKVRGSLRLRAPESRFAWIAYSAVPSCLLLGVTGHITTDIASAPLLWVVPLALYLLSFVNAFARRPLIPHGIAVRGMAWALVLLVVVLPLREPAGVFLPLHLGVFFVVATACHLELARRRPPPEFLTAFFFFVSLGGLLGGAFVGLFAPLVFPAILEYPLGLVLAAALLPGRPGGVKGSDVFVAGLILATVFGVTALARWLDWPFPMLSIAIAYAVLAPLALSRQVRAPGFACCVLAFVVVGLARPWQDDDTLWRGRSFFGVYRVVEAVDPPMLSLVHGTTDHGGQWTDDEGRARPTTYHTPSSPVALALAATQARTPRQRVGLVGLGSGALAYYRRPGDTWRYYEIDPLIVWLAWDSGFFQMLAQHDNAPDVVLGDARLTLTREPGGSFDLLVMEAFSSDAIPTHLLTREAVALYMDKLAADGVLLLHISNRLLDLEPVVAAVVRELGHPAVVGRSVDPEHGADPTYAPSLWVAVAHNRPTLDALGDGWEPLREAQGPAWRDDHSSLVEAIRWTGR